MARKVLSKAYCARLVNRRKAGRSNTTELQVFRSSMHIYAKVIDLVSGKELFSVSTLGLKKDNKSLKTATTQGAKAVGEALAAKCKASKIVQVFLNRGLYRFHGRVAALVEAARNSGLKV